MPTGAAASDWNCEDFATSREAQDHLVMDPSDPDDLDRDGDGYACDWGPGAIETEPRSDPCYGHDEYGPIYDCEVVDSSSEGWGELVFGGAIALGATIGLPLLLGALLSPKKRRANS